MKVKKRDGSEEDFNPVKIVAAVVRAGASVELADKISKEVEEEFKEKEVVSSQEIRDFVLAKLKEMEPPAYENWLRYDKNVKGI